MKKEPVVIFLLFLFLSLLLFKSPKLEENKEDNPFSEITSPFYQEELKEDYLNYQKRTNLPLEKAIIDVNIGLDKPFYTNPQIIKNPHSLTVLVNKYHYLPNNFIPNDLVETTEYAKGILNMQKEAYESFCEMAKKIEEENMHIRIISAYRSYEYQENLYNGYLEKDSQEEVDKYSARPGFSEHQTGLAVDIDNGLINYNRFHITQEFTWMQKNAYLYGFILRYPLGKEKITGYKYEPWHYRYVGRDIAKQIHDNNLTYDEYYIMYLDNKK